MMTQRVPRRRHAIAIGSALLLALAAVGPAAGYTILLTSDQTRDGVADTWMLDDNGDGRVDRILVDGNQDGAAEVVLGVNAAALVTVAWVDSNLDRYYDLAMEPYYANNGTGAMVGKMLWQDYDQNGAWERRFWDGNLDGYYEWVLVDENGDGWADTWLANSAPPGRSATDAMARQVGSMTAFNILVSGNVPIFGPLAWPVGG